MDPIVGTSVYGDMESMLHRQSPARRLHDILRSEITAGKRGVVPTRDQIRNLLDELLPSGFSRCVVDDQVPRPVFCTGDSLTCLNRCNAAYWRKQGLVVGRTLRALAAFLSEDKELWECAGVLHDSDYLMNPHANKNVTSTTAHPMTITQRLRELNAEPILLIAILEHAPHLQLSASTPLSNGLIAANEFHTAYAAGRNISFAPSVSQELIEQLRADPELKIGGRVRGDCVERLDNALISLEEFRGWRRGLQAHPRWLMRGLYET